MPTGHDTWHFNFRLLINKKSKRVVFKHGNYILSAKIGKMGTSIKLKKQGASE